MNMVSPAAGGIPPNIWDVVMPETHLTIPTLNPGTGKRKQAGWLVAGGGGRRAEGGGLVSVIMVVTLARADSVCET